MVFYRPLVHLVDCHPIFCPQVYSPVLDLAYHFSFVNKIDSKNNEINTQHIYIISLINVNNLHTTNIKLVLNAWRTVLNSNIFISQIG